MTLLLADIFTNQPLQYIPPDFILSCTIKSELGSINQLNLKLSKKYPEIINRLIYNINTGISIRDNDKSSYNQILNQVFRMTNEAQSENSETIELVLFSTLYNLASSQPIYPRNYDYSGSAYSFLQTLSNTVNFVNISSDRTIAINTGALNNFELVKEATKQAGWQYTQNNMVWSQNYQRLISQVTVGKFEESPITRKITNIHQYNQDITITDWKRKITIESIKYLEMIVDTGKGTGTGSIDLSGSGIIQNPNYPIVTINGRYYIQNGFYTAQYPTFQSLVIQNATVQGLYDQGVGKIIESNNPFIYDLSLVTTEFVPAGERVAVKFRSSQTSFELEATIKSVEYDFGTGQGKFILTSSPSITVDGGATRIFEDLVNYQKARQYQPQN
jgi:hypothetical protein